MIMQSHPGGGQGELVSKRKSFLEPVSHLCPAKAHLTLELQRARQPMRPPPAHQPGAANPDQQDHPDARGVDDLHQERKRADHRKYFCIQMDGGLHALIIDYMLEIYSAKSSARPCNSRATSPKG